MKKQLSFLGIVSLLLLCCVNVRIPTFCCPIIEYEAAICHPYTCAQVSITIPALHGVGDHLPLLSEDIATLHTLL